jgi:hypothetical protein
VKNTAVGAKTSVRPGKTWWGEDCLFVATPHGGKAGREWQALTTYVVRNGRLVPAEVMLHLPVPLYGVSPLDPSFFDELQELKDGDPGELERVAALLPDAGLGAAEARIKLGELTRHANEAMAFLAERGYAPPVPVELPKPKAASAQQGRALEDAYCADLAEDYLRVAGFDQKTTRKTLYGELTTRGVKDLTPQRLRDRLAGLVRLGWLSKAPPPKDGYKRDPYRVGPRLVEWRRQQPKGTTRQAAKKSASRPAARRVRKKEAR